MKRLNIFDSFYYPYFPPHPNPLPQGEREFFFVRRPLSAVRSKNLRNRFSADGGLFCEFSPQEITRVPQNNQKNYHQMAY